MKQTRDLALLRQLIEAYPEHNCVLLQCVAPNSVCFNLGGSDHPEADYCACEFPYFGDHCEYTEKELLKKSSTGRSKILVRLLQLFHF